MKLRKKTEEEAIAEIEEAQKFTRIINMVCKILLKKIDVDVVKETLENDNYLDSTEVLFGTFKEHESKINKFIDKDILNSIIEPLFILGRIKKFKVDVYHYLVYNEGLSKICNLILAFRKEINLPDELPSEQNGYNEELIDNE